MAKAKRSNQITAVLVFAVLAIFLGVPTAKAGPREVVGLNGTWEIEQGSMDSVPKRFGHKVPVPALVDMAKPAFAEVGKNSSNQQITMILRG